MMMTAIIVDDEIVAVNALKRRVDWEKFKIQEVFTANSMDQAKEFFNLQKIDLLLCDIEMPGGSGLELFEWVKAYHPETECIFVTCHPDYEYMRQALILGSLDYILKPIDYEELGEILHNAVKRINEKRPITGVDKETIQRIISHEAVNAGESDIEKAKKYIHQHISDDICVDDIVKEVHLNAQYFMRIFKKETSMPILEYITNERIKLAKELLTGTEFPINRVADCVGYGNYSYFSKLFKRYTKLTPAEFRKSFIKETSNKVL